MIVQECFAVNLVQVSLVARESTQIWARETSYLAWRPTSKIGRLCLRDKTSQDSCCHVSSQL